MNARATTISLMDTLFPRTTVWHDAAIVASGSLLLALCAQLSFPLPFSPVPITGQTFAVLLIGATFGPRRAAAAMLLYLAEGAAGLPVFAPGGAPGLLRFAGPTAGFLLSYPLAAFLLGWMVERLPRRLLCWLAAVTAAMAVIYLFGATWLKLVANLSWAEAITLAVLPFLPGAVLKVMLVTAALPASWWAVEKRQTLPES